MIYLEGYFCNSADTVCFGYLRLIGVLLTPVFSQSDLSSPYTKTTPIVNSVGSECWLASGSGIEVVPIYV